MIHKGSIIKYLKLRGNTWYYRRRIPTAIEHLSNIKVIYRPLSTDKASSLKLSDRYENMIIVSLRLEQDISHLIDGLKLSTGVKRDSYRLYLQSQDTSEPRNTF